MDQAILVTQSLNSELIAVGRQVLDLLDSAGFKVTAAFWARPQEDSDYVLKIVTPEVRSRGWFEAHLHIDHLIRDSNLPLDLLFSISLADKLDLQYRSLKKHYTVQNGTPRKVGPTYGDGAVIDEAVIYRLG